MRISDWSSDVCSSDLSLRLALLTIVLIVAPLLCLVFGRILFLKTREMRRSPRDVTPEGVGPIQPGGQVAARADDIGELDFQVRSEEHTSELQSLMRISYAVFCLKKKKANYNDMNTKL